MNRVPARIDDSPDEFRGQPDGSWYRLRELRMGYYPSCLPLTMTPDWCSFCRPPPFADQEQYDSALQGPAENLAEQTELEVIVSGGQRGW